MVSSLNGALDKVSLKSYTVYISNFSVDANGQGYATNQIPEHEYVIAQVMQSVNDVWCPVQITELSNTYVKWIAHNFWGGSALSGAVAIKCYYI